MREAFLKQNYHVRVILISIKFVVLLHFKYYALLLLYIIWPEYLNRYHYAMWVFNCQLTPRDLKNVSILNLFKFIYADPENTQWLNI